MTLTTKKAIISSNYILVFYEYYQIHKSHKISEYSRQKADLFTDFKLPDTFV